MEDHLTANLAFAAPPAALAAIVGESTLFPIRRIFCVGRNYAAHAREMGDQPDRSAPFYFTKSRDAFVASEAQTPYPPGTTNFHYEMELVVAIGAPAFNIAREDAPSIIFGYASGLDMTRRDLQNAARDKQRPWDLGKDFECSAVLGPITRAVKCGHFASGAIWLKVNGVEKQRADISDLIHPVAALIAHLSTYYHLEAGDLIYTGTPEGVGAVEAGDYIEGAVEGLAPVILRIASM